MHGSEGGAVQANAPSLPLSEDLQRGSRLDDVFKYPPPFMIVVALREIAGDQEGNAGVSGIGIHLALAVETDDDIGAPAHRWSGEAIAVVELCGLDSVIGPLARLVVDGAECPRCHEVAPVAVAAGSLVDARAVEEGYV